MRAGESGTEDRKIGPRGDSTGEEIRDDDPTAMRHITAVLAKLAVDNRTATTSLAVRQGLARGRRRPQRSGDPTHIVCAVSLSRIG